MERNEFLKRGFSGLLGLAMATPLIGGCRQTAVAPDAGSTTAAGSTNGSSAANCTVTPTETEGPFPTKVPGNLVRKDIRDDRTGIPLAIQLTIKSAGTGCAAVAGAWVDIWHCDKDGYYSEYGGTGMQGTNFQQVDFLRGRQITDSSGQVGFTSVFPGWYGGRAPHIHIHIYNAAGRSLLVTQLAFPFEMTNTVYTTGRSYGYTKGAQDTRNESDNVFRDGFATELATVTGSNAAGYTLTHTIVVNA